MLQGFLGAGIKAAAIKEKLCCVMRTLGPVPVPKLSNQTISSQTNISKEHITSWLKVEHTSLILDFEEPGVLLLGSDHQYQSSKAEVTKPVTVSSILHDWAIKL